MLQSVAASAEESHKRLLGELSGLQPCLEEADCLKQRCQDLERERDYLLTKSKEVSVFSSKLELASVEKTKFVKDFLHYVVKKLFESVHFNQALGDLQQKAITYGRLQALDKVHGKAGQSLEELSTVEVPSIRETPSA
ncbi:hypothetical protein Tco_0973093 [Tanacetum coccineum]